LPPERTAKAPPSEASLIALRISSDSFGKLDSLVLAYATTIHKS
jgi:hypothetical protein